VVAGVFLNLLISLLWRVARARARLLALQANAGEVRRRPPPPLADLRRHERGAPICRAIECPQNLCREVQRIADFVGLDDLPEATIKNVAFNSTFGKMKNNRMVNRQGTWLFDETTSKFMRKGIIRDH